MKITKTVYLYARPDYFEPETLRYTVFSFKDADKEYTMLGQQEVTFDVAESPDPIALAIDVIDRQKLAALQAYHKEVAVLNERLAKLQAITNEVKA